MKKKLLSMLLMFTMIMSYAAAPTAAEAAGISIGDYLQMGTYYGEPILWRCVNIDENGVLMLSDKIICSKPFDAETSLNSETGSHSRDKRNGRKDCGSDYWADSNIRSWLNSNESAGNVTWLCGNPPSADYVNENPYNNEAGFLTNFTSDELSAVKTVMQKCIVSNFEVNEGIYDSGSEYLSGIKTSIIGGIGNYDNAYSEQVTDTMFLLDIKQVYNVYCNSDALGGNYLYIGGRYWLRTPFVGNLGNYVRSASSDTVGGHYYAHQSLGIRPAFYLSDNIGVVGSGTADSPYTISASAEASQLVTSFNSPVSQWSSAEMEEAYTANLIPENLVSEDLTKRVSRSEFASIAAKLYEALSGESAAVVSTPFTDISSDKNAAEIAKAYGLDITAGTSPTTFEPNTEINREQLAAMLCRTIKKYKFEDWTNATDSEYYLDSEGVKKFADDDDISDYAKSSVYYMTKMGIISGIDDTHFAPKNTTDEQEANGYATATREQAIALSLRIYKLSDIWK
ncbi:MAG: S-layer homology domain-containing protein [Clostridiales bacterium]|nr:S-layer homology domain-containing protein [Clostridiales bacterium]